MVTIKKGNDKKVDDIIDAGLAGAAFDTVQKYGSAVKEHLVAYSGRDNENDINFTKSLKSIAEQKTNKDYEFSIRQQKAGWAAEVKDTADNNAENIIGGKTTRKIRYDDLPNTPANHQLFDHCVIDSERNVIADSGTQMM